MEQRTHTVDVASVLEKVTDAAQQAGDILLSYHDRASLVRSYKTDGTFATQADVASERFLIEVLAPLVPGASVYAEETGIREGNEYCWVIDPLDGTTNFAHGLPYFCVSIALTYREQSLLGVVYAPKTKELFFAVKGKGSFLGEQRLAVSSETVLSKAALVMCTDDVKAFLTWYHAQQQEQLFERPTIRDCGASALDLAYCAAGRFDGAVYEGTKWWDVAAASLLLTEAGGAYATFSGGAIGPQDSTFVGGNEPIFKELAAIVRKTSRV